MCFMRQPPSKQSAAVIGCVRQAELWDRLSTAGGTQQQPSSLWIDLYD